jgi:hypothetical protein
MSNKRYGVSMLRRRREKQKTPKSQRRGSHELEHASSCESSALQLQRLFRQGRKVHLLMSVLWHMFARGDAVDGHLGVELEAAEKLGRDEEVLASSAAVFAGNGTGDVD